MQRSNGIACVRACVRTTNVRVDKMNVTMDVTPVHPRGECIGIDARPDNALHYNYEIREFDTKHL